MKRSCLLVLLIPSIGFSQSSNRSVSLPQIASSKEISAGNKSFVPLKDGKIFYEVIDSSFKKLKPETYKSAKMWFADAFKDSKSVLQVDDKDLGELMGKGTFEYPVTYQGFTAEFWCQFTVKVSCRNDKYRLQIYDVMTKGKANGEYYAVETIIDSKESAPQLALREIDRQINEIIKSSKAAIEAKVDTF